MAKLFNRKKQEITPPAEPEIVAQSVKKLEDYEQSQPFQLTLFGYFDLKPTDQQRYSNTIELYDFMPK